MSTYAEFVTEVKQTIEGWPGAPVRMVSDYRSDLERLSAGATKYQLQAGVSGIDHRNSNTPRTAVSATVVIHRRLVNAFDERAYTEVDLQAYAALLSDRHWWRELATVNEVLEPPAFEIARAGNVVSITCEVQVVLKP